MRLHPTLLFPPGLQTLLLQFFGCVQFKNGVDLVEEANTDRAVKPFGRIKQHCVCMLP